MSTAADIVAKNVGKPARQPLGTIRHDWSREEIVALFDMPFNDLVFEAARIHREHFDPNAVQVSTLLSIKTGACPEDCAYCPQSIRYDTGLEREALMEVEKVVEQAKNAKANGATRFCMGAAYRSPKDKQLDFIIEMVKGVKALGMETCCTLGMLTEEQALKLKEAGLDYYNHNIDTSPDYYKDIISTRTFEDRLNTLDNVRNAGMNVCSGGIIGMGEGIMDRAGMLEVLVNMSTHPESVPINQLVKVAGTPLDKEEDLDPIEFVRTIAVTRILMPRSHVRLSAGRTGMSDEMQALCFMAGANSIFYGDKLLTTANPESNEDMALFARLGIRPEGFEEVEARRCGSEAADSNA
ncbi:MAG: biotin synthase BioB [Gammaproteobacteria bacterium]|nr:biotin synthase BioB [Gammaproteobacteria bacterium]